MDGHHPGDRKGTGVQNPAYRPAHRHHSLGCDGLPGGLSHHLRMMGGMDLWYPPNDQPHLLEWWRPLLLASRAARVERFPWPLHIDEVQLVGRVERGRSEEHTAELQS